MNLNVLKKNKIRYAMIQKMPPSDHILQKTDRSLKLFTFKFRTFLLKKVYFIVTCYVQNVFAEQKLRLQNKDYQCGNFRK